MDYNFNQGQSQVSNPAHPSDHQVYCSEGLSETASSYVKWECGEALWTPPRWLL